MAYLKDLYDYLDQQNGQPAGNANPMLSAQGSSIDLNPQGGASGAPRSAGSGTGYLGGTRSDKWVNVQDFLGANQSMSSMAQKKGDEFMSGEKSAFNAAADPLRKQTFASTKYSDDDVADLLTPGGRYDPAAIKAALSQDYTGPTDVDYDPSKRENVYKMKMLGDRSTAVDVLAEPEIKNGSYGLGLRTLDSSLLGADQNYGGVSTGINKGLDDFLNSSMQERKDLKRKAEGFKKDASGAREDVKGKIGGYITNTEKALADKATGVNAADTQKKKDWLKAYTDWYVNVNQRRQNGGFPRGVDQSTDQSRTILPGEEWKYGVLTGKDQANAWNVGDANTYGGLGNAYGLLGKKPSGVAGTYKAPTVADSAQAYKDGKALTPQELAANLGLVIEDIGGIPDAGNYYKWLGDYYGDWNNPEDVVSTPAVDTLKFKVPGDTVKENPELKAYYDYIQSLAKQAGIGSRPKQLPAGR